MKILLCHSSYKSRGGEDVVFEQEGALLEENGHEVVRYQKSNHELDRLNAIAKLGKTIWNTQSEREINELMQVHRPDVLHCTNTFPLISPSVYRAARKNRVAVVQSIHNYRLICPNAQLMKNGRSCERCVGKTVPLPAIYHRCYRDSRAASAAVTAMSSYHNIAGTWRGEVDRYIAISGFVKRKMLEGGLPAEKIRVKSNFVQEVQQTGTGKGDFAVYVGRLSEEKGIRTLLEAWKKTPIDLELRILGDGPLMPQVRADAETDKRIKPYGHMNSEFVGATVGDARFLIAPSIWQEPFGLIVIEAFARGTPVIATNTGALPELVKPFETGLLVKPADSDALKEAVEMLDDNKALLSRMRTHARQSCQENFLAPKNHQLLLEIYNEAIAESRTAA